MSHQPIKTPIKKTIYRGFIRGTIGRVIVTRNFLTFYPDVASGEQNKFYKLFFRSELTDEERKLFYGN